MTMIALGIDPGSHMTGYGVVEKRGSLLVPIDNGCISARKQSTLAERLGQIHAGLMEMIEKFHPDVVAIEEVFFAKNVSSMVKLGESRGVALLAATQHKIPVYEYSPREVKQAITGYGQATKGQVQKMIVRLLKLPEIAQVDASDALAVAVCHLNSIKMITARGAG